MKELKDYLHYYLGCEVQTEIGIATLRGVNTHSNSVSLHFKNPKAPVPWALVEIKPVLRTIDSITIAEQNELEEYANGFEHLDNAPVVCIYAVTSKWYLERQFDLFGLIESNLAIDAARL